MTNDRLENAVEQFKDIITTNDTFGPDALPSHMGCSEAVVFSELLDALGIPEEASSLRRWHFFQDEEDGEDANGNHPDWTERVTL